ncbi:hypothetical protein [Dactylosporangium sp. CA-092794]|uniref:hypothetical protein n=1 Tax=Dactylosporangium sp. CA-092794 TaxID=3239929 RepID=UPI003D8D8345
MNRPVVLDAGPRGSERDADAVRAARARPVAGLFELAVVTAPDGGFAAAGEPGRSLSATELAAMVRAGGGAAQDVRVPAVAGEQNLPTLTALARELGRDVLVGPAGSELRAVPGADGDDPALVDPATGLPVDWIAVQPSGAVGAAPTWFRLAGGTVRARTGAVVLPMPGGGISFATRPDFVTRRAAAAALGAGPAGVTTVAVGTEAGDFVVGDYDGRDHRCDGRALAAALGELPLYGTDLRVWLDWPGGPRMRRRLRRNLTELAEATGASVWAPAEGGRVTVLHGCRDLGVVDPDGRPGRWERFGPTPAGGDAPGGGGDAADGGLESDEDGRLVPAGGVVVTSYPGVELVSVPPWREREFAQRREAPERAPEGGFRADLGVLADGRLALLYHDGSLVAAGGRQLALLLRRAGWRGGELTLVSGVAPERLAGAREHAARLAEELDCAVVLSPVPAVAGDDVARALGAGRPAARPRRGDAAQSAAGRRGDAAEAGEEPPVRLPLSRFIDGPRLGPAARNAPPPGVPWLPAQLQINAEDCELFVECATEPDRAVADGVPSPHLFLIAHLDGERLAARTATAHLLRLRVPAGAAVDAMASDAVPPRALAAALREPDAYLLPAGWLDRCRVLAGYRAGPDGRLLDERTFDAAPVVIRSLGARHGVPGLPDDVKGWPHGRMRRRVTRYVAVRPGAPDGLGAWQPLHHRRPDPAPGLRVLAVRVERGRAIDVAATLGALHGLATVRTRLPQLIADGVRHLLPAASYRSAVVEHEYRHDGGRWHHKRPAGGLTLDRWSPT